MGLINSDSTASAEPPAARPNPDRIPGTPSIRVVWEALAVERARSDASPFRRPDGSADPNDPDTTYLFPPEAAPLFVSELLDWAGGFPGESEPILADSGKDGLIAVFSTADRLRKLVHGALVVSRGGAQDPANQPLPAGYKTPRSVWVVERVGRSPSGKPDYRWARAYTEEHDPSWRHGMTHAHGTV